MKLSSVELLEHEIGDGERGGEARGFNAEKMNQPRHTVLSRALDPEILHCAARTLKLGTDPGIARCQRAIGQARPVAPDGVVEALAPGRVDAIVEALDPFHIRAEARAPGQIEGEMDAEPRGLGHGIDEMAEGRARPEDEVVALGEVAPRHLLRIEALEGASDGLGLQPGGVHEIAALEADRRFAAYL